MWLTWCADSDIADGRLCCRMWSSSLTGSASKGMPDIEKVSTSERLDLVADAFEVTGKPLIYDGVRPPLPRRCFRSSA